MTSKPFLRRVLEADLLVPGLCILYFYAQALLYGALQLFPIELLELPQCIRVDRINHVDDLQTLLAQGLQEGGK